MIISKLIDRIFSVHSNNVQIVEETYKNMHTPALFFDKDYGEFWKNPYYVINKKRRHPKHCNPTIRTLNEVKQMLFEKHGDIVSIVDDTYTAFTSYATFVDKDYGEYKTRVSRAVIGVHPDRARKKKLLSADEIENRIKIIHNNEISLDKSTYVNTGTKCRFIDKKYGEWWAIPSLVLRHRGHPHGKISKVHKTMAKTPSVFHWKTNEECICCSGYEWAVLNWLNEHKIDYDWQIPFITPFETQKKTRNALYIIDLYIKDGIYTDTFVEIKGRWTKEGKQKFDWFSSEHSNTQLWDCNKLLELKIIDKKRTYLTAMREVISEAA